jgi:site-specific DNA-methyltransferase (cytosine-N4-specific)
MILQGDALTMLRTLPDEHVQMTITSPPYWQLRDYRVAGQLGLEPSYDDYISKLCDVFDEVKRVLRHDGTCWVILADTYSGSSGSPPSPFHAKARRFNYTFPKPPRSDIPKKSLCLIPFRFAIEMVCRGWILRNVLIWKKPNALPESVRDRFTIDFEYLFFFAKSHRYYFKQQLEPAVYEKGMRNHRSILEVNTRPLFSNHFAAYPEELIEMPMKAGCPEGGTVLEPFLGSGTTGVVAERLGRRWLGIELNPDYVQLARERLAGCGYAELQSSAV